jgi:soluble lytic murein transglycosylase
MRFLRLLPLLTGVALVPLLGGICLSVPATAKEALAALPSLRSTDQRQAYAGAFEALDQGRVDEARRLAREGKDRLGAKIFRWAELQQPRSGASFEDIAGFMDANPGWPNQDTLARRAEEALIERTDDSVVLAWFVLRGPATADGAMRYIEALQRAGERDKALKLIRDTWVGYSFGGAQESQFLKRYKQHLGSKDHVERLDRLIWDGRREEARRQMNRVDGEWRALAEARLRLQAMSGGVDPAIRKVPAHLIEDPGLLFERLRWRRRKGQEEGAREILRAPPHDLERPELWWNERAYLARKSISAGRMSEAYAIVKDHRVSNGASFVEAEFLAGWISLRFLDKPDQALTHFTQLHEGSRFPVTKARGAYWAGRAAAAKGDVPTSREWFQRAASYATAYYGQLAATALDPADRPAFPETPKPTGEERQVFDKNELADAARFLQEIQQLNRVKSFVTRLVLNARTPGEHALVAEFAAKLGRPDLAVSAAKRSAQVAGVMIPDHGWPTVPLTGGNPPERALILATIRQESAFEADAISRAGARGLMQLIPPTARAVAKQLNLPSDRIEHRLLEDTSLNLRLGRAYLGGLIDDYGGSYVLAIAAYNAGPGRVQRWIKDNGDPRKPSVDVVDWIEMIPIDETRNYVHRVLENLQVYRWRLGTQLAYRLDQDLRRNGRPEVD